MTLCHAAGRGCYSANDTKQPMYSLLRTTNKKDRIIKPKKVQHKKNSARKIMKTARQRDSETARQRDSETETETETIDEPKEGPKKPKKPPHKFP